MSVLDPVQLRTFLTVLEHGGFSRAAVALHIGQSTVSFHIRELEEAAGTKLLDRLAREVRPTAAGDLLQGYASRILALHDEALARMRAEETGELGRVVVAASSIPAEYVLPNLLAAFRKTYPSVQVVVEVDDSEGAIGKLVAGEADVAVVGARFSNRRLAFEAIASDDVVLVATAENSWLRSNSLTRADLRNIPLVLREHGSGTRRAVASFLAGRTSRDIEVGSTEALKRCVLAGLGLGFVSQIAVADELADGRLVSVALPGIPARRALYLAHRRDLTMPAAARELADLIRAFRPAGRARRPRQTKSGDRP